MEKVTKENKELNKTVTQQQTLIQTQNQNILNFQQIMTSTQAERFNIDPVPTDDVKQLQEELNKMRAESKAMKQRLKMETEARKTWQDMSRKKDDDLNLYKQQLMQVTQEVENEKNAHQKTQTSL